MHHIPQVLSLVEIQVSACEQKYPHTDLTDDQTQNPPNESPVFYPGTSESPHAHVYTFTNLYALQDTKSEDGRCNTNQCKSIYRVQTGLSGS